MVICSNKNNDRFTNGDQRTQSQRDQFAPLRYQVETILMGSKVGDLDDFRSMFTSVFWLIYVDLVKCDPFFYICLPFFNSSM